ncbi:alpha,alpha-phosphotrehalase [Mitsuokella sp. oral taxon 131]|uniref:alpha,alpha-phosphotrehalase n=1 Tax=Mitsuokella sp. oral taxon 131 TaxID=1321780 RepID=UPI0003ADB3D6|nr:alpha,alpha-phosphotrehalase [Mitsuokella sp. oral taxon 131]ERL05504.1 alpha,alpha-phosphotrehalase [Mitsuokella sp. oral taxon 131 str. W9106]
MNVQDKVVYQIYPKSFYDTNGDGLGDLKGVTAKLGYLKELGVDLLWLTPFFPSPQNDGGYDVADYCAVDPRFGTMEDVETLIREARARGIGLMFDMVFNHTSTDHEWFRRALKGDPTYLDYYIFKDGVPGSPPTNWESKFGGSAWEYVPALKKYYLHLFDVSQADLNWENPRVREALKNVIRFWKAKGVEGFRFDVVNLISKPAVFENDYEGDGRRFYTDGRHVHEFLKELTADTGIDAMITVGEMSSTTIENCIRYSNPKEKELSMTFSFHHLKIDYAGGAKWALMPPDIMALKNLFADWQEGMEAGGGWNAVFWCNHDQPRIVSRLGDDVHCRVESAKMLGACIHLMRGTPYIYQGEELGMTNAKYTDIAQYEDVESRNYYKILLEEGKTKEEALHILGVRSRDNSRTPMQWSAGENAGFTTGTPWLSPPANYKEINAEAAQNDPDSVFHFYQKLIRLRKERPIIQAGTISFRERANADVVAYERARKDEKLRVYCNFRATPAALAEDSIEALEAAGWRKCLGNYEGLEETLRPYEVVVLEN